MDIVLWMLLGGIAGWLASSIMKTDHGLLTNVILGIIGALVGGLLMNLFGQSGVTGFNLYSILVAAFGAILLIWLGRRMHGVE